MKHKEPLLAVLLSVILPGLGQIYASKMGRGVVLMSISTIIPTALIAYILHPDTRFHVFQFLLIPIAIGFAFMVPIDAYRSAKSWNMGHNLERKITTAKKTIMILSILFVLFIFNPMEIVALAVTYHIRANIAQPYKMASDSMCPALMKGDRFFVNKAIYRRLEPQRGDIVVFDYPVDPKRTFIERLVGLPGETVELRDGRVVVNGVVKTEGSLSQFYYYNQAPYADEGQFTTVPADSYFVLGDNSGNSMDSRSWGFVPKKNLTGKAYKIYWPLDRSGPLE